MFALLWLVPLAFVTAAAAEAGSGRPDAEPWAAAASPAAGFSESIGSYANGCIAGAAALAAEGPGHQVIRLSRNRFWGHPALIGFAGDFDRRIAAAGLGPVAIGDLSQPRGGPMSYGHASHQIGLDMDVWLRLDLPPLPRRQREGLEEISMIDPATRLVDPARWSGNQARLVQIAAEDPRVARIFAAPGIKAALCRMQWPDRAWLRKVRPWYGHTGHIHLRLHCPADSPSCREQDPIPPGDGCGEELASWFAPPAPRLPARPPAPRPPLPDLCHAVLAAPAEASAASSRLRPAATPAKLVGNQPGGNDAAR